MYRVHGPGPLRDILSGSLHTVCVRVLVCFAFAPKGEFRSYTTSRSRRAFLLSLGIVVCWTVAHGIASGSL